VSETNALPLFTEEEYRNNFSNFADVQKFVMLDCYSRDSSFQGLDNDLVAMLKNDNKVVLCLSSQNNNATQSVRRMFVSLSEYQLMHPVMLMCDTEEKDDEAALIHYAVELGSLLIDGMGDGISMGYHYADKGLANPQKMLNSIAFGILQATRTRISKTEYISCPSCGRTLFDLQETTARIRAVTHHLKGIKIAIMGCIVNGPGEMADADFGYVGSGVGKITLYKNKEIVKRNIDHEVAVDELIMLLKENNAWVDPVV
jgi:(E)-4-hydroxy-3-methylbut-2-enyl-diphosphate synthase